MFNVFQTLNLIILVYAVKYFFFLGGGHKTSKNVTCFPKEVTKLDYYLFPKRRVF